MSQQFLAKSLRTEFAELGSQALRWHSKGKVNEATVQARKERKRMKETNQLAGDYTGERPPHPWMSAKRLRSLATAYQNFANKNRLNVVVDKADKIKMKKELEEYGAHEYFRMRCEQLQIKKNDENLKQVQSELDTLPFALHEEMANMPMEKRNAYSADINNPYFMYFEQIGRMFDEEHFTRLKLSQRLQRLAEDKLGEND